MAQSLESRVGIIGGGLAGLSCAVTLLEAGIPIILFESAKHLGGRARRVTFQATDLDNGQHILLGAYHETLKMLKKVGVQEEQVFLRMPLNLEIKGEFSFKTLPFLPHPFHLILGMLCAKGLRFSERLRVVKFLYNLNRIGFKVDQDCPLSDFLTTHQQSGNIERFIWNPLCLATMNTPLHLASTQIFLNVLFDGLMQGKSDSDLLIPKSDLTSIFSDPMANQIKSQGGHIMLGTSIQSIHEYDTHITVVDNHQKTHKLTHLVVATHLNGAKKLGIRMPRSDYPYQPIYTIYIQFPHHVRLTKPMLGLEGLGQWVFDHSQIRNLPGLLSVVISAEGFHQKLSKEVLAEKMVESMRKRFAIKENPIWTQVIAEKHATLSITPGLKRPNHKTHHPYLYLTGDYTQPRYPCTIEGAIQSGINCAQALLNS
jgi:hydroxysqualene dehydroxylase